MTVHVYAMNCGWQTLPLGLLLANEHGRLRVPTPSYLIEHPRGRALFDSGMHLDCRTDPEGRLGEIARLFAFECEPTDAVRARLATVEVDAADITFLVNSHLHFDHSGGNAQIPNARLVVQRPEWEAAHTPEGIAANYYYPRDYDLGHDLLLLDGEHDLFGDGSVVCMPTYGHTPGHQSLRVQTARGEIVLAGDACYLRRTLDDMHLPGVVHDEAGMRRALEWLGRQRAAGARIFFGHDPEFWADVPQAPTAIA